MKGFIAAIVLVLCTLAPVAYAQAPQVPTIEFKTIEHNFEKQEYKANTTYSFEFKNTSKVPLILTSVSASCGCTTPEWPREPILPGKTGKIKVTYNSQIIGAFTKLIYVYSNASTNMVTLTIKGEILPPK
ncbi:DUF1573 domain-containing protein [Acetobacteroides hydrogenigenes]|uniref:Uncharacterized protein DUF1573 n=1 Tax=Acetobacteroides hydrogenigenes TaxID=979970 RepID=A0A4V2RQ92_9BACT|nr:DUF1573 domain-containing protein [Acetobacteroides hydrogenigenes]TCN70260.1 uncharacterized protein DUF1573 [Acetobacteroides hydrogenigenes]